MYQYVWDSETGGPLLTTELSKFSKEPRPVYYKELDILGFDKYWNYPKDDSAPLMWAESNKYIYKGRNVANTKGGSLYTAPEIILLEEPEPNGKPLEFVDIEGMVKKNSKILETLVQETIQNVYNVYLRYKDVVDIFHISYSGGKDSEVTLDIVQQAIPHNDFVVLFGDTGMEFPDTYSAVENQKELCRKRGIDFYTAKANKDAVDMWKVFGYPSSTLRWCCGVHKTAPQLLKLREILNKSSLKEMAFVGVRGSESVRRSKYDYLSFGTKHGGQYSFNPILEWDSVEVYLYLYYKNLNINNAYKMGSSRAGCLFCPMATEKSDYINRRMYPNEIEPFIQIIKELYADGQKDEELLNSYMQNKGWKARKNGRDLTIGIDDFLEDKTDGHYCITIKDNGIWKEWIKTVGDLDCVDDTYFIQANNSTKIKFDVINKDNGYVEFIFDEIISKDNPTMFKNLKNILKKSHSCVGCKYCEANCPSGNIMFVDGKVKISEKCKKCGLCNKVTNGCLVYNSLILSKGNGKMRNGSYDEYGTHPAKIEWINHLVQEHSDTPNINKPALTPYRRFLRNAGIIYSKNEFTKLAELIFKENYISENLWALILTNLAYSQEVGWLVRNLDLGNTYSSDEIKEMLSVDWTSKTGPGNVANCYKKFTELPFAKIGFAEIISKNKNWYLIQRTKWLDPDSRVILYSLYKFAEMCGEYYQFTLSELLDNSIERDGVSPTKIFGLDYKTMVAILNGLTSNYPDFINASFSLNLETITLKPEKKSEDVLSLF